MMEGIGDTLGWPLLPQCGTSPVVGPLCAPESWGVRLKGDSSSRHLLAQPLSGFPPLLVLEPFLSNPRAPHPCLKLCGEGTETLA